MARSCNDSRNTVAGHEWLAPFTQPSSVELLFSPTSPFERLRSSCGLLLTWCASQEPSPLFSLSPLAVILCEPLPISHVAPAPSCAVRPPILLGSVGLHAGVAPNRLTTRSPKSLGLCSLHVPALACAPYEAAGAHWIGFPPPRKRRQHV
jgi:hypothetical protein